MLKSNKVEVEVACTASVSSGRGANSFFGRARIGRAQKKKIAPIFARPKHRNLRGNPTETPATQAKVEVEEDGQNRRRLGLFLLKTFQPNNFSQSMSLVCNLNRPYHGFRRHLDG